MTKNIVYSAKKDAAAEWAFYPSSQTKRQYPNAEMDYVRMDVQDGEIVSLAAKTQSIMNGDLIIEVPEGTIKLIDYDGSWQQRELSGDPVVWDIDRIVCEWSNND